MIDTPPPDDVARLRAELTAAAGELAELQAVEDAADATSLVPAGTNLPADEMKSTLAARYAALAKKQDQIRQLRGELEAAMRAQLEAADALLRPLKDQMRRLEEGIWAVTLYLGREEEIVTLREGEAAPADTPLHIRQLVLAMDEEVAAFAESGGMDWRDLGHFDEWLGDDAHLEQVAPWPRCVVVFRPRHTKKRYADPLADRLHNEENRRSYWLLRNGENLYRMTTDLEVGDRLVARSDEFTSLFRTKRFDRELGHDVEVDLEPGSSAWARAEAAQGEVQRHYMRCALVLQGLIDRTRVFHPYPGGAPFSLLRPEAYEEHKAVIVADDDTNAIGTGRAPFYTWLADLNRQLRPGMRIIGAFDSQAFRRLYDRSAGLDDHRRIHPRGAEQPPSRVIHRLDGWAEADGVRGLSFHYERRREDFYREANGEVELRAPKTRARCVVLPDDRFVLPFDLVEVDEMRTYLAARTERHAYESMMPLLHAAIAAKEEEAAAEAPFRRLLVGEVARRFAVAIDADLEAEVAGLVREWKLANRWHRPLVSSSLSPDGADEDTERRALEAICTAYGQRRGSGDEEAVVARFLEEDPSIMYVGRARTGRYVAFAPQPRRFPPSAAADNAFVVEYRIGGTTGRGKITRREWVLPGTRAAKLRQLHATEAWEAIDQAASANDHLSDDELDTLAREARPLVEAHGLEGPVLAVTHDLANKTFEVWAPRGLDELRRLEPAPGRFVSMHLEAWRVSWTRSRDGVRLATSRYRSRDTLWRLEQEVPWYDVFDGRSRRRAPIWQDRAVADEVAAVRAHLATVAAASAELSERVRAILERIERAWRARELERERARFLDLYGDEELWEQHRTTLRFSYPSTRRGKGQPLWDAACAALEVDTSTLRTVADLWDLAVAKGAVDAAALPEDLAALPLDAAP